ncbi:hypothetical protein VTN31DRAFT_7473 [Thermomyces dupontii]|uniref:uncharacterized protein n=1 Tax=Talaromyces thermophilus TaxID=28565 RepID=UPI003742ED0D
MPPKKAASASKKSGAASHASYKDMIKEALLALKERNGSSRQSLKKYILANNKITLSEAAFNSQFNKAIKTGVEKGEFTQPKGPSGPLKLAKKDADKPAAKKTATAKTASSSKKPATKKAAKESKESKDTSAKPSATKKSASKPKANTARPRKTSTMAPAIVEQPKVISQTKSGRVVKTTAPAASAAPKRRTAAKKSGTKESKESPKKSSPKKGEAKAEAKAEA